MDYSLVDLVASQRITLLIYPTDTIQLHRRLQSNPPSTLFGSVSVAHDISLVKELLIHSSEKPDRHQIGVWVKSLSKYDLNKQWQTLLWRLFLFKVFQTSRVVLAVLRQLLRGLDILRHRV